MATKAKGGGPARSRRPAPARKPEPRTKVRHHLAPWARDAFGIGLVVFALISILALWFDAAGFAGHGIRVGLGLFAQHCRNIVDARLQSVRRWVPNQRLGLHDKIKN